MPKITDGIAPTDVVLPQREIHEWLHEYRLPLELTTEENKLKAKENLLAEIKRNEMLPFYRSCCAEFGWEEDLQLIEQLENANQKEMEEIEAALVDANENFGDVEVKDCLLSKANFFCRIGDLKQATEAYEVAQEKTVGSGGRLDVTLTLIRLGILFNESEMTKKYIAIASKECEKGGDWERRNKLKIYMAISLTKQRRFAEAAQLLYNCVAIFTASELISFDSFIFITVTLAMATFERPELKSKIMPSPEISQVLEENLLLKSFLHSFFYCKFKEFMHSLVKISYILQRDQYLMNHMRYLTRALRLKAYKQYLEPFSSVMVEAMAKAFGVSEQFIEEDVADFIANGKLNCKIDRINGVIVCIRHMPTDALYLASMKEAEVLLSKIQKLSKIIDI